MMNASRVEDCSGPSPPRGNDAAPEVELPQQPSSVADGLSPIISKLFAGSEKVAQSLFDELAQAIPFKKASLQLIIDGKRLLIGAFGFKRSDADPWLLRPVDADPIIRTIVSTRQRLIIPDTAVAENWQKRESTADVNSWIGMPLVLQGETIGILTLDHDQPGYYANTSPSALARLDQLAGSAAHDIRFLEAYFLQAAQRQIRSVEIIRNFAEKVGTKLNLGELLVAIAEAISQGLKCTECIIFLAEQRKGCDVPGVQGSL